VLLLSFGAHAQDVVDLATISEINITLNDDCQALLIPSEILTGDFDVDDNGIIPEAFTIVVEDGQEGNGPIIDGCGIYTFRITADAALISGFTTGWGTVNAEDKTAPFFTGTPVAPAGPLYCDAVDGIDLGALPNTVSRCYSFNTQTGAIVAGTLDPALRARLVAGGGLPTATDACSELIEICVNDIIIRDAVNPACNDVTLTRTFTATDGSCVSASGEGNAAAVVSYDITFTRPTLDDLNTQNIQDVVTFDCDDLEGLGLQLGDVPAPRPGDLPFFDGPNGSTIPLIIGDGSFCGIGVTFEDQNPIVTCPNAYKVVRTYTIIDWCNTDDVRTLSQIVKVGDFTAPVLNVPAGPIEFGTNAGNVCGAYIRLDLPGLTLTDACSSSFTLLANIYPNGDLTGTPLGSYTVNLDNLTAEVSDLLPVGDHVIRYTYTDECGNIGTTDVDIRITDATPPVAICENGLNVSLSSSVSPGAGAATGIAVLTPEMIDKGSYDDCSGITLEIARVRLLASGAYELLPGAAYGPNVVLTCADLGVVPVGLKVTDADGMSNFCWMDVLLEDKTAPVCIAPADFTLSCVDFDVAGLPADITDASDELLDLTFGVATGSDNCEVAIEQRITGGVNSCGLGEFRRTFVTTDGAGFTNVEPCRQIVEVVGLHDYVITLPGDASAFCRQTPNIAGLLIEEGSCDLITTEVSRDTFTGDAEACYKIRLEYSIINWCEYNSIGEPYEIPRDYDGDNNLREVTFLYIQPNNTTTTSDDVAYLDNDNTFDNNNFAYVLDDGSDDGVPYGVDNSRGAFSYTQFVKVSDQVAPQIVENNSATCFPAININCTGPVELTFELTDNCTAPENLGVRIELDVDYNETVGFGRTRLLTAGEFTADAEGNYTINLVNVPIGEHAIRVRGSDGCGNVDVDVIEFCMVDGLAPTPICIMQTTVSLAPNGNGTGEAAYWASDALVSEVQDCSGDVTFSIYKEEEIFNGVTPAPGRDGILFTCEDDATTQIRVYAFDPAGRNEYCSVLVLVQRAENACNNENYGEISGSISTFDGSPLSGVGMELTGPEMTDDAVTDNSGTYAFDNLTAGDDYTLDPHLISYLTHSQGVSTFDLVLITRYILGTDPFVSPYQHIAADANNSGDVTVQDIIAISRLILGLDLAYPDQEPWVFVDADFVFPVGNNPWATSFPEVININNLPGSVRDGDFIGIMVGNVSDNRPGFAPDGARPRGIGATLETEELMMVAGKTYEVIISAGRAAELTGMQGTFDVNDRAELIAVAGGRIAEQQFNTRAISRGVLPFSYYGGRMNSDETLATLTLTATVDGPLSEALTLSDARLRTEGYTENNDLLNLGIRFTSVEAEVADRSELFQNTPNPVAGSTTIGFQLTEAGQAQLTVRDISGRVVLTRTTVTVAGSNTITLDRSELGAAGVMTYTLTAGDFTATRKMVVR